MENSPLSSVDSTKLRESMARRLYRRSVVAGEITLPAVPGMIDEYVKMCDTTFAAVGCPFTAEQLQYLRSVLEQQLAEAYAASQRSNIVISYNSPIGTTLNYHVRPQWLTIEGAYEQWIATREPPLFGTEPDARVWSSANETADPRTFRVLDIGAGTGRNALALARRGHPVDVVEMTQKFADMIRADAARELLNVRVIQRDVFTTLDDYDGTTTSSCSPKWWPSSARPSTCAPCSNSLPVAWLPAGAWCSICSSRATATHPMMPLSNSGSRCTPGSSPGTKRLLRRLVFRSSYSPTIRCTSTRKHTCPRARGHRHAGMPGGPAARTCSTFHVSSAPSKCAGSYTRSPRKAVDPALLRVLAQ